MSKILEFCTCFGHLFSHSCIFILQDARDKGMEMMMEKRGTPPAPFPAVICLYTLADRLAFDSTRTVATANHSYT